MSEFADSRVAVIGIGCRFPGGADTPAALWRLLLDGRDTVGPVPAGRWPAADLMAHQHPDDAPRYGRGCFVEGDIWAWEPTALAVSPQEGATIDPQHRLAMEVAREAVEHAGLPPDRIRGSRTGVYLGLYALDFLMSQSRPVRDHIDGPAMLGGNPGNAPGRIAFALDLRGPAMAVETLCSSGLVAVHTAARALAAGECDMALAGASMLMTSPESMHAEAPWLTSRQGRCFAFDGRADGFVRGEGCGMLLLKRHHDAVAAGDRILAVLRGSAVTCDGQAERLTAPSALMQEAASRLALERAGVDPGEVGLVEAHGAGTLTGDPVEYTAVNSVYGRGRDRCALGSIKTNIGHTEPVSGVAGLIKAVWAVRTGQVPANLNFREWSPQIAVDAGSRLFVPTATVEWPVSGGPRLAAVASSGLAGTNAHVLVEQAPATRASGARRRAPRSGRGRQRLFLLSTPSAPSLPLAAARLADHIERESPPLPDLAHTLAARRTHTSERLAVQAGDHAQLTARLRAFASEGQGRGDSTGTVTGRPVLSPDHPGPVFVFTGQGSQSPGMCQQLLDHDAAFTAAIDEVEPLMAAEAGFSVRRMIAHPGELSGDDRVQPTLFAVQYALAAMWRSFGVEPAAVIGQSLGEITASVVTGGLSLEDGILVSCRRARLATQVMGGAMASVVLGAGDVRADLDAAGFDKVAIAVLTAPTTTVVSGDREQVEALVKTWQARDIPAGVIRVDYASHSAHVDPILDSIRDQTKTITPRTPAIPLYGTTYDDPRRPLPFDGDYWALNLRDAVRFTDACTAALQDGHRLFIECSPNPLAVRAVRETAAQARISDVVTLGSLRRGTDDVDAFLANVAAAHCAGAVIDWQRAYPGSLVDAPPTTWHRTTMRPAEPHVLVAPGLVGARQHSLLGGHVHDPDRPGRHLWQTPISAGRIPWLADHQVAGTPVMAGAGLCEMALAAAGQVWDTDWVTATGVDILNPLILDPEPVVTVRAEETGDTLRVEILTRPGDGTPVVHARATLTPSDDAPEDADPGHGRDWPTTSVTGFYQYVRDHHHVVHGPAFNALESIRVHPHRDEAAVTLRIADEARHSAWMMLIHPALLDEAVQAAMSIWCDHYDLEPGPAVVAGFGKVEVFGPTGHARTAHLTLTSADPLACTADALLTTADGTVVARITGLRVTNITPPAERFARHLTHITHTHTPAPDAPATSTGTWLVLAPAESGTGAALVDALTARGATAEPATPPHNRTPAPRWWDTAADPQPHHIVLTIDTTGGADPSTTARDNVARLCSLIKFTAAQPHPPRLWITAHHQAPGSLTTAGLRGVVRTAAYEHPELATSLLTTDTATPLEEIARELLSEDPAPREVHLTATQRLIARLAPAHPTPVRDIPEPGTTPIRPDGSYLLTGGLGGLGLFTLQWLAGRGAGHVVLIGRNAPTPHARTVIAAAQAEGTQVSIVQGDIADRATTDQAIDVATTGERLLRGVLHAAGVVTDATLATLDDHIIDEVWRGKAEGAWHLHQATTGHPLDFFALYSSMASLIGSPGQAAYAAANAFLDDLTAHRAAHRLPATSVNWGAWASAGRGRHMADHGLTLISPTEGTDALDRILATGHPQLAYAPLSLERWLSDYPATATSALFAHALRPITPPAAETSLLTALDTADEATRRDILRTHITDTVRTTLKDPALHITATTSLVTLGVDSLTATQLRARLQHSLGIAIDPAALWASPTPAGLTDWILAHL
ncbi:SDR family NAD(P)-dependent oxidoreductase [Streptomyces sp. NPDC004610]|uniref:type I polyketide synthase n=1 Tax=unclassified Streptomyces TaxID=2593676 RepID=UPI0033B7F428